ncbi:MAG: 4-hydroxy-tetrahydrodipicolinate synthase [Bdellovibrio sp. CG10_big_fil_rev_8_21_14_0_10_47_8]|nr:MAG: 4-hydroxy-tetrahydrodipicolinate synthase [Bdellovibrio sp. CG10_big_fil_rev_8_21_14_0_10_47_8]
MKSIGGVITALITPFKNQDVDYPSLERLIKFQLKSGVQGFVINGTTAESPTLETAEKNEIFNFVRARVPNEIPLIMGTGSNSTQKTIEESIAAEKLGADAILVVVPYYNKPPQRGLVEHFKKVADSVSIPTILYNVPSRTITSLELESIQQLSLHPKIIGIKEASGNVEFAREIRQKCGKNFLVLSGDDGTYDEFMEVGGDGVISVASHVVPEVMLQRSARANRDLIDLLFVEANPIPVKKALHLMGIIDSPECRLPLVTLSDANTEKILRVLMFKGLVK